MKSQWYVYIAKCCDNSLYTGITVNIESRVKQHVAGRGSKYVFSKGIKKILYAEMHPDRSAAQRREYEIKSWPRAKKLLLVQLAVAATRS